jgi:hypothetical protein
VLDRGSSKWGRFGAWSIAVVLAHWCSAPLCADAARDDAALLEAFRTDAPLRWEEYASKAIQFQGTIHFQQLSDGVLIDDRRNEFQQNKQCKLCVSQSLMPKHDRGELLARNPDYAFSLERQGEKHPWTVAFREPILEGISSKRLRMLDVEFAMLNPLTCVEQTYLSDLVRRPTFTVTKIAQIEMNGETLVRVEFDNTHPVTDEPAGPMQSGVLILDPQRYWCLRTCDLQLKWKNVDSATEHIENEIADLGAKFPKPKRTVNSGLYRFPKETKQVTVTFTSEFELEEASTLPADDKFTLSAYGFPERGRAQRRRWYLWSAGVGIALVCGALLLRRIARSGAKTGQAPA